MKLEDPDNDKSLSIFLDVSFQGVRRLFFLLIILMIATKC